MGTVDLRQDLRKDKETREEINAILASFKGRDNVLFWLGVLVKEGRLSASRAGQIIDEQGL